MPNYADLNPAILKPGLTTADGANLKPGLVTPAYSGGVPSNANQVKPSLLKADGTLKAGLLTIGGELKPSLAIGGAASEYEILLASARSLLNGDANRDDIGDPNDTIGSFNGTWVGTPIYGIAPMGKGAGKSFVMDGSSKAVTQASDAGNFITGFTIAAWVKVSALTGRIVSKRADATFAWDVYLNADGSISYYTGDIYSSAAGVLSVDAWHHVALAIDRSAPNSRIYVDGVASGAPFLPSGTFNTQEVNWGRLPAYGGLGYLPGELYQCGIWDRILTSDECALLATGD